MFRKSPGRESLGRESVTTTVKLPLGWAVRLSITAGLTPVEAESSQRYMCYALAYCSDYVPCLATPALWSQPTVHTLYLFAVCSYVLLMNIISHEHH